ncbi:MAG: sigma-54-dependent Fis family transcriptional regulator [Deltaproteobacteria bacterium]|nr:sigma-54-dependent Fis family transcriptional regulator [Deltaproteobacteria bacterium]
MAKVLIIDDDQMICRILMGMVIKLGHHAVCRYTRDDGMKEALSNAYDVILLDVQMPDGSGLDLLPEIRKTLSAPEVIIMTGFGDTNGAELAIENGAWDYIQKSDSPKKIMLSLQRVIQYREGIKGIQEPSVALKLDGIIGSSSSMQACFDKLAQAATSDSNVLLTGETGTGKELFARAIHENSTRSKNNFVVVDCAALPESLVESLLFGHKKGAFTGAEKSREGLVKQSQKGTLFLDEIGELPLSMQKVFLRVLQEHSFRPVGGREEIKIDFRMVAATNRDLTKMVRKGLFREDLLFRIKGFVIRLPPLRERQKDMASLLMYYLSSLCQRHNLSAKGLSVEFLEMCGAYDWPGNIRELVNCLETAILAARYEPTLFPKHLPNSIRIQTAKDFVDKRPPFSKAKEEALSLPEKISKFRMARDAAMKKFEIEYFKILLSHTGGNTEAALRLSGLGRSRFYELLRKHK